MSILLRFLFTIIILTSIIVKCNYYQWTKWNNTESCKRNCSEENGQWKVRRNCEECHNNMCKIVNQSKCSNSSFEEFHTCYDPNNCDGDGLYTGKWSNFENISNCTLVSEACNSTYQEGFQKRERKCSQTSKSKELATKYNKEKLQYSVKCPGNSIEYTICKVILVSLFFFNL